MFRKGWICVIINFPFSPFTFAWPSCKNFNGKKLDIFSGIFSYLPPFVSSHVSQETLEGIVGEKKERKARCRRVIGGDMGGH